MIKCTEHETKKALYKNTAIVIDHRLKKTRRIINNKFITCIFVFQIRVANLFPRCPGIYLKI
jgi:hypothetical protein